MASDRGVQFVLTAYRCSINVLSREAVILCCLCSGWKATVLKTQLIQTSLGWDKWSLYCVSCLKRCKLEWSAQTYLYITKFSALNTGDLIHSASYIIWNLHVVNEQKCFLSSFSVKSANLFLKWSFPPLSYTCGLTYFFSLEKQLQ